MWRVIIGPRGTLLVLPFFLNTNLTEGPIANFLQSAGTIAKQKEVQGQILKYDQSAGTKDIFKLNIFQFNL